MDPWLFIIIVAIVTVGVGWLIKMSLGSRRNRTLLEARIDMDAQVGKPEVTLLRFALTCYGRNPVMIMSAEFFVGQHEMIDIRSFFSLQTLPYTLHPGETLSYFVPSAPFARSLLEAGARRDARLRASFKDYDHHHYDTGYSITLEEMSRLDSTKLTRSEAS